jgi:hypothetical protein
VVEKSSENVQGFAAFCAQQFEQFGGRPISTASDWNASHSSVRMPLLSFLPLTGLKVVNYDPEWFSSVLTLSWLAVRITLLQKAQEFLIAVLQQLRASLA